MAKKRYRVELAPAADRQRRKLPSIRTPATFRTRIRNMSRDKQQSTMTQTPVSVQKRIVRALEQLETDPRPPGVRKLQGEDNLWRLRVGDHRVIYTIENDRLLVLVVRVANRRDAYGN